LARQLGLGAVAAPRRVIALASDGTRRQQLQEIARSRTEPASRVERARIALGYLAEPSASATGAQGGGRTQPGPCLRRIGRIAPGTRAVQGFDHARFSRPFKTPCDRLWISAILG
jgi:hypothetical protein